MVHGGRSQEIDGRSGVITGLLFALVALIFMLSPVWSLSDAMYSMVLSESVLENHSTHLNRYRFPYPVPQLARCVSPPPPVPLEFATYQLDRVHGNVVYCYPNGSSILSIPFVALMNLCGIYPVTADGRYDTVGESKIQRLLAAILMAGFAVITFRLALILLGTIPSLLVAVGSSLGTQVWSTASRAMWAHTWLIFLGSLAAYMLLSHEAGSSRFRPMALATLLSWMYFTRPTAAIPIVCISIYVIASCRRDFIGYSLTGVAWFAGFVCYSWFTFGKLIPDYYLDSRIDFANLPGALPAVLFSPSRGLFVFVPVFAFVIYLLIQYRVTIPSRRLAIVALSIVLLQVLMVSLWPIWWGGYSYGPRLLTDALPWMALLAVLGLAARASGKQPISRRRIESAIALALLAVGIAINGRGAASWSTMKWNLDVDIDRHPERASDWNYPQFMAGLIEPPKYP